MATNDFLVFGGGAGANVITQVTYSGLTARTAGFSAGVAPSAQLNKVWRQSSIMSAVLAQFISDLSGQDVLDDGTTATILTNLKAAVSAQSICVVGSVRSAKMAVSAASASATYTADEVVVESALGGKAYRLPSFNKTINLATTGVGGMDTGAPPNNGFVALYAIYNPTTGASGILGRDATSVTATNVYSGANIPSGYTASALIGLWPTDGTGKLKAGLLIDRQVSFTAVTALNTAVSVGSFTSLGISSIVPKGARSVSGYLSVGSTSTISQSTVLTVASDANGSGGKQMQGALTSASGSGFNAPFDNLSIGTDQTIYYQATTTSGTPTYIVALSGYQF